MARLFLAALAVLPAGVRVAGAADLPPAEEVQSALERVLSREELRPPERGWLGRLWDSLGEWLDEVREWILTRLGDVASDTESMQVVISILIVILLLLLAHMLWTILSYREPAAKSRPLAPGTATASRAPDPHLAAASSLAGQGKFREAMEALYLGVVLWMDLRGHLRFQESKTGREYAREVRSAPLAASFRSLVSHFYPVAFGGRPAGSDAYERMRTLAGDMGVLQ